MYVILQRANKHIRYLEVNNASICHVSKSCFYFYYLLFLNFNFIKYTVYASKEWTILYGGALYTSYVLGPCAFLSLFLLVYIFYFSINDKKKRFMLFSLLN
jgi:hypothetical protein